MQRGNLLRENLLAIFLISITSIIFLYNFVSHTGSAISNEQIVRKKWEQEVLNRVDSQLLEYQKLIVEGKSTSSKISNWNSETRVSEDVEAKYKASYEMIRKEKQQYEDLMDKIRFRTYLRSLTDLERSNFTDLYYKYKEYDTPTPSRDLLNTFLKSEAQKIEQVDKEKFDLKLSAGNYLLYYNHLQFL